MTELTSRPLVAGIDQAVSQLALGTAFFRVDAAEECFELLDAYVDAGGTLIDSGRVYGDSEEVLGRWLASRGRPDGLLLLTKGAHGTGEIPAEGYPELLRSELDTSLGKLGIDCVDVYLLHRDNQQMDVGSILEPLNEELSRGRVRAIGASNWEYRRLREAADYADRHGLAGFAVVSNNLSLARPASAFYRGLVSVDAEGERWHAETGTPLLSWSSQARGFFAGGYSPSMRQQWQPGAAPASTFTDRMLQVYATDDNFQRLERARQLGADRGGYTAVEVALAWLLHRPCPVVPIVGPRSRDELDSCVRAASLALTDEEVRWLDLKIG